jgi:hypothetical protein
MIQKVSDPERDPIATFNRWAEGHEARPEFLGMTKSQATESAHQKGRFSEIRVLDLGQEQRTIWHMNLRPDRLNMVVRDGVVIAAALF